MTRALDARQGLREALDDILGVDHHAHLMQGDDGTFELGDDAAPLAELILESNHPELARSHIRNHPSHYLAIRELAALLGTPANEEAVSAARRAEGHAAYVRRLLQASRLEVMFVDDGLRRPGLLSLEEQQELTGIPVRRVVRIEVAVEDAALAWPAFDEVRERFRSDLAAAAGAGLVALKTIAAYRCGLALQPSDEGAARAAYTTWRETGSRRLVDVDIISFFIAEALDVTAHSIPLQVHTGLVGADMDLHKADPALLRGWLNSSVPPSVPVVLLHCYPFLREASWLASLFANVFIDLSMAMQWVVHRGAELVLEAVDIAPVSKLLFATDGFRVPELFYLGAKWWRDALAEALTVLLARGQADDELVLRYANLVLRENAHGVYGTAPQG